MAPINPTDRIFKLLHNGSAYSDFSYEDKRIRIYHTNIWEVKGTIKEIFREQAYKELDVKGRQVVDAGASVCDTAIYFMLKGAKAVYAFEPVKERCELAERNISYNRMHNIKIFNAFLGTSESEAMGKGKISKRVYSLDEIVKRFKIKDAILKLDCEGAEYETIQHSKLSAFSQIMMEYHKGTRNLPKQLMKHGFKVTKITHDYGKERGYIIASRKSMHF